MKWAKIHFRLLSRFKSLKLNIKVDHLVQNVKRRKEEFNSAEHMKSEDPPYMLFPGVDAGQSFLLFEAFSKRMKPNIKFDSREKNYSGTVRKNSRLIANVSTKVSGFILKLNAKKYSLKNCENFVLCVKEYRSRSWILKWTKFC